MTEHLPTLRQVWTEFVTPEDYEAHMAAVGQAQANAELVKVMLEKWPPDGRRLLFAGAGTGQILDFTGPDFLEPYQVTFTDINAPFLDRIKDRLARTGCRDHHEIVDDLENTQLEAYYSGAVVVLVLEHIHWRKGIESLAKLQTGRCYIVIQENPPELSPARQPVGSMSIFLQVTPKLVPAEDLIEAMCDQQYSLIGRESRTVADEKKMVGLVFERSAFANSIL